MTHFSPKMADPEVFLANGSGVYPGFEIARPGMEMTLSYPDDEASLMEPVLDLA